MKKVLVDSSEELNNFIKLYNDKNSIIFSIIENNSLVLLFFYIDMEGYYLIPVNLHDMENIKDISFLKNSNKKKLIFNKREFLKLGLEIDNIYDIYSLYYLYNLNFINNELDFQLLLNNSLIGRDKSLLSLVSVYNYFDYFEKILEGINKNNLINLLNNNLYEINNFDRFIKSFNEIEKNGLYVDRNLFKKYFNVELNRDIVYSKYNLYNFTGRPGNICEGINLNSLKKNNNERSFLISRFRDKGKLLLLDYDAYHFRLVSKLIKYSFPKNVYIYEYLGKKYFGKDKINSEEYKKIKGDLFKILYSKTINNYTNIDFFKETLEFIDKLFNEYNKNGYINSVIFKRKLYFNNIERMNKYLLFNYYIQNYETENNLIVIENINKFLKRYESKLIMYNFDSFLIDYKEEENILNDLKEIIERDNFLVKSYLGNNFNKMEKINNN